MSDRHTLLIVGIFALVLGVAILVPIMTWKYVFGWTLVIIGIVFLAIWLADIIIGIVFLAIWLADR
jgi:hypothetical protein